MGIRKKSEFTLEELKQINFVVLEKCEKIKSNLHSYSSGYERKINELRRKIIQIEEEYEFPLSIYTLEIEIFSDGDIEIFIYSKELEEALKSCGLSYVVKAENFETFEKFCTERKISCAYRSENIQIIYDKVKENKRIWMETPSKYLNIFVRVLTFPITDKFEFSCHDENLQKVLDTNQWYGIIKRDSNDYHRTVYSGNISDFPKIEKFFQQNKIEYRIFDATPEFTETRRNIESESMMYILLNKDRYFETSCSKASIRDLVQKEENLKTIDTSSNMFVGSRAMLWRFLEFCDFWKIGYKVKKDWI